MKSQLRLSGGRKILSPQGIGTRPTSGRVREAVMNLISRRIKGSNWLDLCSGSGIMSCEALQRGARRVLAVEKNKKTAKLCKANLMSIASDLSHKNFVEVICCEVISALNKGCENYPTGLDQGSRFDLVYFDPPYGSTFYSIALEKLIEGRWLKKNSLVICEYSSSTGLDTPHPWIEEDRRIYGSSALLLISPP